MALTPTRNRATSGRAQRDPLLLAAVFVGGAAGTVIRSLLSDAFPHSGGTWPWTTFCINVSGTFLLGLLLEGLVRSGEDTGTRRLLRLGLGTGVLGGFTTYSTFMVETTRLAWLLATGYVVATVVLGGLAARLGIRTAKAFVRVGETH